MKLESLETINISNHSFRSSGKVLVGDSKRLALGERLLELPGSVDLPTIKVTPIVISIEGHEEATDAQPLDPEDENSSFGWFCYKEYLLFFNSRCLKIFRYNESANSVQLLQKFNSELLAIRANHWNLGGSERGSIVRTAPNGRVMLINTNLSLSIFSLRKLLQAKSDSVDDLVRVIELKHRISQISGFQDHWYALDEHHSLHVISSKSCKVVRQVQLKMKHADDNEDVTAFAGWGREFLVLSHYDGSHNQLQAAFVDGITGKILDFIDMKPHADCHGLLAYCRLVEKSKHCLYLIGCSGRSMSLVGCFNSKIHCLKMSESWSNSYNNGPFGLYFYRGRQYGVVASTSETNIFKLNYSLK